MKWFVGLLAASVMLLVGNKALVHVYPYVNFMILFQNTICVLIFLCGTKMGYFQMKKTTKQQYIELSIPSILFTLQLYTSLKALAYVKVATTVIFRNLCTLLCVGAEITLFGKKFTNEQVYSLVLILLGSFVYSLHDLDGVNMGYVWLSVNTIIYAVNNLYTKAKVSEMEQTADGVAYIEQLLTLPLFLGLGTASGEFPDCVFSFARLSLAPMLLFIGLGFAGTLIAMSYSNLYKTVNATSVVVASNINKVISILLAYLCFGKPLTLIQVGGLGICIAGGMCYSFASSAANKSAKVVVEEEHLDLSNEQ